MPRHTCTRIFTFDAAHRVLLHESKCKHPHGHTYKAEVTVQANGLDDLGRVVDFSVIKEKVGKWIDENWDHNIILHPEDPLVAVYQNPQVLVSHTLGVRLAAVFAGKAPFVMPGYCPNPTAENLARVLREKADELIDPRTPGLILSCNHVRLWETPNCYADSYAGDHR